MFRYLQEFNSEYEPQITQLDEELRVLDQAIKNLRNISDHEYDVYFGLTGAYDGVEAWAGNAYNKFCRGYEEAYVNLYQKYVDSIDQVVMDMEAVYRAKEAEKEELQALVQNELSDWVDQNTP